VSEDGLLLFITDIPEQAIEEPLEKEKEAPVLQESSNAEQQPNDGLGNSGLKSVLSAGKTQSSWPDGGERPVVTFKENIKPREPSRSQQLKDSGKERRDFNKGNGVAAGKTEPKRERDGKRKSEMKKAPHEKTADAGKQVRTLFKSYNKYFAVLSARHLVQSKSPERRHLLISTAPKFSFVLP